MTTTAPDDTARESGQSVLGTISNIWAVLFEHKSLVALGLLIGLVLGGLAYLQTPTVYQSTAQVLVIKKRPEAVVSSNGTDTRSQFNSFVEDYLPTHVTLIQSTEILKRAAHGINPETLNDTSRLYAAPIDGDMVKFLKQSLIVAREKDKDSGPFGQTNVLKIAFRGSAPGDCPRLLDAVLGGYRDFLAEAYSGMNDETLQLITRAQDQLKKELADAKAEHEKIWQQNPLILKAKDGIQIYMENVSRYQARRNQIQIRQKEIESRQQIIASARKEGLNSNAILSMIREVNSNRDRDRVSEAPLMSLEAELLKLKAQFESQRETMGLTHPTVTALKRQIDYLKDQLARYGRPVIADPESDPLKVHEEALAVETRENRMVLEKLEPNLKDEELRAQDVARYLMIEEQARKDVDRLRNLFDSIADRLRQINITREASGFDARTITPAASGLKVAPSLLLFLALSVVAGTGIGVGLAYLADFTDKSFRSPQEIQQRLGLPVIGHIPFIPDDRDGDPAAHERVSPALVAFHAPRSPEAEAFRGVRTSLYFSTQGSGHQVIQVTSPGMGDGKSTLTANLAVSIAQTGRRVILIDADFRRPRVHKLFPDTTREIGMASVICGDSTLDAAIQQTAVPNLWLMPCGPRPANPAELLTSPRFQELLTEIRQRFDFVLVDTPPVLLVSDPCVVAPRVDGVILVLRLNKNNRPAAERATEVLGGLGANVLGIIVNDSNQNFGKGGKYGYGYGYGYRYNYRYSYQYGYGYQAAYADSADDEDEKPAARFGSTTAGTNGPTSEFHANGDADLPAKG